MQHAISHIEELKKQLLNLGYFSYQINNIISGNDKAINLTTLSSEQLSDVIEALTNQINFAKDCKNTFICKNYSNSEGERQDSINQRPSSSNK
ncbi:MAG: hypothetical protein H6Q73_1844 [Firmicutes bacterium]|nr:hypothetical protein [Bacillota bacterium]